MNDSKGVNVDLSRHYMDHSILKWTKQYIPDSTYYGYKVCDISEKQDAIVSLDSIRKLPHYREAPFKSTHPRLRMATTYLLHQLDYKIKNYDGVVIDIGGNVRRNRYEHNQGNSEHGPSSKVYSLQPNIGDTNSKKQEHDGNSCGHTAMCLINPCAKLQQFLKTHAGKDILYVSVHTHYHLSDEELNMIVNKGNYMFLSHQFPSGILSGHGYDDEVNYIIEPSVDPSGLTNLMMQIGAPSTSERTDSTFDFTFNHKLHHDSDPLWPTCYPSRKHAWVPAMPPMILSEIVKGTKISRKSAMLSRGETNASIVSLSHYPHRINPTPKNVLKYINQTKDIFPHAYTCPHGYQRNTVYVHRRLFDLALSVVAKDSKNDVTTKNRQYQGLWYAITNQAVFNDIKSEDRVALLTATLELVEDFQAWQDSPNECRSVICSALYFGDYKPLLIRSGEFLLALIVFLIVIMFSGNIRGGHKIIMGYLLRTPNYSDLHGNLMEPALEYAPEGFGDRIALSIIVVTFVTILVAGHIMDLQRKRGVIQENQACLSAVEGQCNFGEFSKICSLAKEDKITLRGVAKIKFTALPAVDTPCEPATKLLCIGPHIRRPAFTLNCHHNVVHGLVNRHLIPCATEDTACLARWAILRKLIKNVPSCVVQVESIEQWKSGFMPGRQLVINQELQKIGVVDCNPSDSRYDRLTYSSFSKTETRNMIQPVTFSGYEIAVDSDPRDYNCPIDETQLIPRVIMGVNMHNQISTGRFFKAISKTMPYRFRHWYDFHTPMSTSGSSIHYRVKFIYAPATPTPELSDWIPWALKKDKFSVLDIDGSKFDSRVTFTDRKIINSFYFGKNKYVCSRSLDPVVSSVEEDFEYNRFKSVLNSTCDEIAVKHGVPGRCNDRRTNTIVSYVTDGERGSGEGDTSLGNTIYSFANAILVIEENLIAMQPEEDDAPIEYLDLTNVTGNAPPLPLDLTPPPLPPDEEIPEFYVIAGGDDLLVVGPNLNANIASRILTRSGYPSTVKHKEGPISIDTTTFYSSAFWPVTLSSGQESRILGPLPGRFLYRNFYVRKELHEMCKEGGIVNIQKQINLMYTLFYCHYVNASFVPIIGPCLLHLCQNLASLGAKFSPESLNEAWHRKLEYNPGLNDKAAVCSGTITLEICPNPSPAARTMFYSKYGLDYEDQRCMESLLRRAEFPYNINLTGIDTFERLFQVDMC